MSLLTEGKELIQDNTITSQSQLKTDINMESSGVEETKDKDLKSAVKQENQMQFSKEHITVAATLFSITILSSGGFIGFENYEKNKNSKINQQSNQSSNNFNTKIELRPADKNNYKNNKSAEKIIDEDSASEDSNNPKNNIDIQANPTIIFKNGRWQTVQSIVDKNPPKVIRDGKVIKILTRSTRRTQQKTAI